MNFIKKNSYNVVKLMINQFGMMVFALVLSFATAGMQGGISDKMVLLASIFSTGFYMVLIYYMVWELGAQDIIRVEAKRQKYDALYGLKLGLLANLPNFIVAMCGLVGYLFGHAFSDADWGIGMLGISYTLSRFIQAPYLGIVNKLLSVFGLYESYLARALIYFVTTIPSLVVTTFAYILGCKNFRFIPAKNQKK